MPIHSKTYTELKPENIVHTTRLNGLLKLLQSLKVGEKGKWADFGCSDGFILGIIRSQVVPEGWELTGFDFMEDLLQLARQRNTERTTFAKFDLNTIQPPPQTTYDIVTCFETMEHVGNYRHAVDNLVQHLTHGGWLVISVPNETGFPGLLKLLGRRVLRKNPYRDFFKDTSAGSYITSLLFHRDIEPFRHPEAKEWGVHLGFNYKNLFSYIDHNHIRPGTLKLIRKESSFIGFNKIFVFQKRNSSTLHSL